VRILMLGDSPFIHTGFGIVNNHAMKTLLGEGHRLIFIGAQDTERHDDIPNVTFIPIDSMTTDMMGWAKVPKAVRDHKPQAVHIIADPATVTAWLMQKALVGLPVVVYTPVEGAPMNIRWTQTFINRQPTSVITVSKYGQNILKGYGIPSQWAYHGVDNDFQPQSPAQRAANRDSVGWSDKFVVMCVAQNVRRKQWPRLFEAIALLKKRHPDILLYAHTVPFNNFWLDGHDLPQLAEQMGIEQHVIFSQKHTKHNASIPTLGVGYPGLVDFYNMADVFCMPSQVEGFGMPLAEAMACGLPVIATDYAAGAEVVGKAGVLLPVHDWECNKSHSLYANVAPRDIANAIERLKNNPTLRAQYSAKGIERAKAFRWDDYQRMLKEEFRAAETYQAETAHDGIIEESDRKQTSSVNKGEVEVLDDDDTSGEAYEYPV
jgi:glycosyltransferase involved in cell wall biosynthesis